MLCGVESSAFDDEEPDLPGVLGLVLAGVGTLLALAVEGLLPLRPRRRRVRS